VAGDGLSSWFHLIKAQNRNGREVRRKIRKGQLQIHKNSFAVLCEIFVPFAVPIAEPAALRWGRSATLTPQLQR